MKINFWTISSFTLPAQKSGCIYRINQAVLSLTVEVTKADGNKPADGKKVALANNSINALFQRHYP